jgi:hypothetical protein
VFLLELHASDMHAALGRLLDQVRVAGIRLAAVSAEAGADDYRIFASFDINDRDVVERLARRIATMVCIGAVEVRGEYQCAASGVT